MRMRALIGLVVTVAALAAPGALNGKLYEPCF